MSKPIVATVLFENVGREKKTFECVAEIDADGNLSGSDMMLALDASGALLSNDVQLYIKSETPLAGTVVVGGVRTVGTWRIVPVAAQKPVRKEAGNG